MQCKYIVCSYLLPANQGLDEIYPLGMRDHILVILERLALYCESVFQHGHRVAERKRVALNRSRVMRPDGFQLLEKFSFARFRNAVEKTLS